MGKTVFYCFILSVGLSSLTPAHAQEKDAVKEQIFGRMDSSFVQSAREGIPFYAPVNYGRAKESLQNALDKYRRGDKLRDIQADLDNSARFLKAARDACKLSKIALEELVAIRNQTFEIRPNLHAPDDFGEAEAAFDAVIREAEAGDMRSVRNRIPEVEKMYRSTVLAAYEKSIIKTAEKNLRSRKDSVGNRDFQKSKSGLEQIDRTVKAKSDQSFDIPFFIADTDQKIRAVLEPMYPEFYRNLPDTLMMAEMTLYVLSYSSQGSYDFNQNTATGLAGEAELVFQCGGTLLQLVPLGTVTGQHAFRVVLAVKDPEKEISLSDAVQVEPNAKAGQVIALPLEVESTESSAILSAKQKFLTRVKSNTSAGRGRIRVRFEGVSITPTPRASCATVTAGKAFYPTASPDPEKPAKLRTAGFTVLLDSLSLTPTATTASARLVLPSSLIDDSGCRSAVLNLGIVSIESGCQIYKDLPDSSYGPFIMDQTGMVFKGKGYTVDLSTAFSKNRSGLSQEWTGVILKSGTTSGAQSGTIMSNTGYLQAVILKSGTASGAQSGKITSNTGYLQAVYQFSNGLITPSGLKAELTSTSAYSFSTSQPPGYTLTIGSGSLDIDSSAVQSGQFAGGSIQLPSQAVCSGKAGSSLTAYFNSLTVQKDLDMAGYVALGEKMYWGELTRSGKEQIKYAATPSTSSADSAFFYLCGTANRPFTPKDSSDFAVRLTASVFDTLEARQIGGITVCDFRDFDIMTTDIPKKSDKITFKKGGGLDFSRCWLNVGSGGINGSMTIGLTSDFKQNLGDSTSAYYKGKDKKTKVSFKSNLECDAAKKEQCLRIQFSSSAVYDSEFNGELTIKGPSNIVLPFEDLEFTSTAHIVGGDIDLSDGAVTLEHWGVDLVATSTTDPAGVLSVKTGQVIFTQAGIEEKRHFAATFKLYWGEMFADGNIGKLFFDYNSAGQKFDGFDFTPKCVTLSEYRTDKNGYLHVCGDNAFDFFGSNYLSIHDSLYTQTDDLGIYDGRRVAVLTDTLSGCQASNLTLKKTWSSNMADFDYTIGYDVFDQDGFFGEGTAELPDHFGKELDSSIQLDSTEISICLSGEASTDFKLGGFDFGAASELWGCISITDNTLSCVTLGYTLEAGIGSFFGILGGGDAMVEVKEVIKPTFTSFSAAGKMGVNFGLGKCDLDGSVLLTMDEANDIVTGDIQGELDFSSLFAGLKAEGQVNWYLSEETQYIQGRAALQICTENFGGGASGGIFFGNHVPADECWVLLDENNRFSVNLDALPDTISGVYGYGGIEYSVDLKVVSGGIGIYAGVGLFSESPSSKADSSGIGLLPFVLANIGVSAQGELFEGLLSASVWIDLQHSFPYPYWQGSAGLEACALWVFCTHVDVTACLSEDGFDIY
jgi:hypothetical protein